MKTIATILATAAALTLAIAASGFDFDLMVVVSIAFASGIAGLAVSDYSRAARCNLASATAPEVQPSRRVRRSEAGVEFATLATFNTMVG
jgi:hypothetical protein